MTDEELAAIKARCAAATPGPWVADSGNEVSAEFGKFMVDLCLCYTPRCFDHPATAEDNSMFIAHARTDVPALVAEVERLRSDVARLTAFRDEVLAQRKGD